ncbi:hypothetical protein CVT26_003198 [Gymnopilus dilepis]|uniref:Uncharacterized protein n=1 Tax=Gymnopilus dilepis TaxID=231916 RepID=A0A409X921_9AGAR|nr:hypothetical protein CVT26_003198 [Gymnopilus dilepis]
MPPKTKKPRKSKVEPPPTPEGFTQITGPRGSKYMVPNYLVPATHQALAGYSQCLDEEVFNLSPINQNMEKQVSIKMGETSIRLPCDPPPSLRECLQAHAEVIGVQQHLGLSYKDAAHRLYHAEYAKILAHDQSVKALSTLTALCLKSIEKVEAELNLALGDGSGGEKSNN